MRIVDYCRSQAARGALLLLALLLAATPSLAAERDQAPETRLTADQRRALAELRAQDPQLRVSWDAREAVPRALSGRLSAPSSAAADRIALDFARATRDLFRIVDVDAELTPPAQERDALEHSHVRFTQLRGGVPVFAGELRVHLDRAGVVTSVESELLPAPSVSTLPALSASAAAAAAAKDLEGGSATQAPELFVFDPGRITGERRDERLAWRVVLSSAERAEWVYFVDAHSGEVAYKYRNVHEARDREVRGYVAGGCNRGTLLYNEAGPVVSNPTPDATSAYNFSGDVHGYYMGTFGRDSYDGAGARMITVVNWPAANAQWSPSCGNTMFGTGWVTKDVVAHEWQHAVTTFTANLTYSCQSGALNESFSDVFGAMVDRDDWLMGEDLAQGYIRSLADPRASRPAQPDTNNGANACAEVHHNSGIPNKVGYLLSDGGVHYGVTVPGLGRGATEQIWHRALRFHMGAGTDFAGAREAMISAANELYGTGSAAACSVMSAWASVAVGSACTPPTNNAAFVSQSVPTSMVAGQQYGVSVTMRNTGTTTWTSAAGYKLGSQNPQDNGTWGLGRVALPASVAPGAQVTFTFTVTAPASPGNYNFQWRMLRELVEWFGQTAPNVVVAVQPPVDNAAFVSQSVPTSMTAGQTYSVSITMRNTGGTTWTSAAGYKLGSQSPANNTRWGLSRVALGANVAPGATRTFSFTVTAPTTPGSYSFQWRMLREGVAWFGAQTPNVAVSVGGPSASIAWIRPAEDTWGPPGTLTAAGYAANGSGGVQLVWRERSDSGVWGPWTTVAWQPPPSPDTTWSNTISSGNPTNRCHWFDAYVNYSGVTSAVFHYTGAAGCGAASASIAWIQPAEQSWGPAGTLTAAGYATNGSGGVQLVWRERSDSGVWGAWTTVAWQPAPSADTTWSNTISSGNPTNRCHWFDAYVNYSGATSAVYHYTGTSGCP